MMRDDEISRWFRGLDDHGREDFISRLTENEREDLRWHWDLWARRDQLPDIGSWTVWLICAGRGFGKTRAGAEWVRRTACLNPQARIALVGGSLSEVRAVMVEGESGILACSPPHRRPDFEPSLRRLVWTNGAQAQLYSAGEPESLRGPQHSHAWCDEIGKWDSRTAMPCWDNLLMGLRLGLRPRIVATTTPRAKPLMRRLLAEESNGSVFVARGSTYDNAAHLPAAFMEEMTRSFGATTLGRQEIHGELLADIEGALWSRDLLEKCRRDDAPEEWRRVVVAVDPPASAKGDACGIVVAALGPDSNAWVLADCSVEKAGPERWARAVADASAAWSADRVVAEANQGGAMVASVLRAADISLPVKLVHASRGKVARAEPVAALYEAGRVRHAGLFAELEDQLCGLMAGGAYEGPGRSPDRADALVWALTELMLGKVRRPSVSAL